MMTESYEKIEVTFDSQWQQWLHDNPERRVADDPDEMTVDITFRDGYSTVAHDLTIEQATEVRDLIDKTIAEIKGWKPEDKEAK